MDIFKELNEKMEMFSENISKEIAEKRFYQMEEVKTIAKTSLWMALYECLKIQVTKKEEQRRDLVKLYGETTGRDRLRVGTLLSSVNSQKADANRLLHTMNDYNEYEQLRKFVKLKFGKDSLTDFYDNYLDRNGNNKKPKLITK